MNLSKWQPNWLGPNNTAITKAVNGAEVACYDPAQVSVSGGYLHLKAVSRACTAVTGEKYSYASGLVNTNQHFRFTDGKIEARVNIAGNGSNLYNWPAFWTDGQSWPNDGENDIVEGLSGNACWHYHSASGSPGGCVAGTWSGWHVYSAEIHQGRVSYWYDGIKVGETASTSKPHYIIFNLGVGGYGGDRVVPSEMLVDWIHVSA